MTPFSPSATTAEGDDALATVHGSDRRIDRWIGLIWALLFFNVLTYQFDQVLVPITRPVGQLLTGASLALALLLAARLNRRLALRPNLLLSLASLLALSALMTGVRLVAGPGAVVRSFRLIAFVAVLWLLTPWWGRRDLLLARCHLRVLLGVCASVLLGAVISPSLAFAGGGSGRLVGVIWPIPATQVAEYAALATGMALILWMVGHLGRLSSFVVAGVGVGMIGLTQTRTALVGLVVGLTFSTLSLFCTRRRVRYVVGAALVVVPLSMAVFAPAVLEWARRGQSSSEIADLTGRRRVWDALIEAPRPEFNRWFGFGLSEKSFDGLAIDNTWLAAYQDEGLVGVAIVAAMMLTVLVAALVRRPGPERAIALFLVAYCITASYTEVGISDASPYLLTMVVAASLVAPGRPSPSPAGPPQISP